MAENIINQNVISSRKGGDVLGFFLRGAAAKVEKCDQNEAKRDLATCQRERKPATGRRSRFTNIFLLVILAYFGEEFGKFAIGLIDDTKF